MFVRCCIISTQKRHLHRDTHTNTHTHAQTHKHTHIHTHNIHTHTNTHAYTNTHTPHAHLTRQDPKKRATAQQVLRHDWLHKEGSQGDTQLDSVVLKRMRQFAQMNKLKKMCLMVVGQHLSLEEIAGGCVGARVRACVCVCVCVYECVGVGVGVGGWVGGWVGACKGEGACDVREGVYAGVGLWVCMHVRVCV
jgi:hypothetical protein